MVPDIKPKDAYLIDALIALANIVYLTETVEKNSSESLNCSESPFIPWAYGEPVMEGLRKLKSSGLTGELYFDADGYNGNTEHEILSLRPVDNSTDFIPVGSWNHATGLQVDMEVFRYSARGFNNVTFIIGTKEAVPFVRVNTSDEGRVYDGFCVDILNELALQLNFRYRLVEPLDSQWGSQEKNGSFNGIVGMVNRKELDFGIGPFGITAERERGIDFTTPFMEDGIGIVMKRPTEQSNKLFRMFQPFNGYVWLAIGASVTVIGLGLFFLNRLTPPPLDSDASGRDSWKYGFKESLWLIFASLMEQGGESHPRGVSSRMILAFWWLFTILIVSSYTANLAAFLTVTILDKPINTLEDLANNDEITPLVKTGTNIYSLFRAGTTDVYREIWRKIQDGPRLTDNVEAYEYVRSGEYAFMVDKAQLEYLVKRNCQTFMLAEESFNNAGVGFVFPEDSPMVDDVSFQIIRMQEAGLIERWRQKWWPTSDTCDTSGPASQAKRLGLDSTGGPFIIFAIAASLACICLLVEVILPQSSLSEQISFQQ
ncbi:glutamate receptor ionotropic, delta-1-like [Liolophura sinensis]|uniref:glutamate receptor ionotropic, delta-1-like n=1 Tax=Liolophura sinensis TaxID=3198878 RepID=UPI003158D437